MRFFRRLLPAALAILSFTLPGSALGQAPLSPDKAFSLTVTREADGDLAFAWDIAPGHYLYRDHTVASTPGGKESLQLELAAGDGFRMIATQLDRIIGNLVDNAYAYGAPPVCVATARTQEGWRLTVEDQGPGIPAEAIERVTMPFVRLDPARGGNAHSGLGLAIVDRLVRQGGGRLTISNREEGGLRVEMVFPFTALAQAA